MSKVAVVTDSSAYLPKNYLEQYNISVAPLVLLWGNEVLEDGVDILPGDFYTRLKTAKVMPSTSQVTPQSFDRIYKRLGAEGYDVLALVLSSKLSGTVASAVQAREMNSGLNIEIVDSESAAMALGFQVLCVARAAAQGATLAECKRLAEAAGKHAGVIFAVDSLEFLYRGGRIGGASRYLGTALNIKPILELVEGKVEGVERVRTRKKSLVRLVDMIEERIAGRTPVRLATLHANAISDAQALLAEGQGRVSSVENILTEVSPVIGSHVGPGTVGLAFMAGEP